MVVKYFTTKFSELAEDNVMRCDEKFFSFFLKNHWILYPEAKKRTIQLRDILKGDYNVFNLEEDEEYKGIPTGGGYVDEDGEINDYQSVNLDNCPGRIKYTMTNDNIAISSLRLAKAPAIYFEDLDLSDYIFSNGYYIFKIKNNWNKKFILYVLRVKAIKKLIDNNIYRGIGISAYREEDLLKIKIPDISIEQQNIAIEKIEPIEQRIKQLKATIKPVQEVINKVFSREFGFSENLYQEFGKGMTASSQRANTRNFKIFSKDFFAVGNNKSTRFSTRYHNPPTEKLMNIMNNMKTKKVKDVVMNNDKGIQPNYSTEGTIPVIKIANMKNLEIDFSECEFISEHDFLKLNEDKKIKRGDIIICGTGKASLGKIDIYESDEDTVTTVDNIVLRLSDNYNKLFFVYFFRSILGYFQIERDFTGATNQIHLYRDGVSEFLIPDISFSDQERIVEEIQMEIDKQDKIRKEIQQERNRIDEIIESIILSDE